ncbi:EI24 domain-containing protein [Myxococcota bacterium]
MPHQNVRPGFVAGVTSLPCAVRSLMSAPRLWPCALAPAVVFVALFGLLALGSVAWVRPWVLGLIPEASRGWGGLGAELFSWLAAAAALGLGWVIATVLTPALSSPALERIVAHVEKELGVPVHAPLGFFKELLCGLRAFGAGAMFAGPILLALWTTEILLPPAVIITVPLQFVVTALWAAWGLFDYPLTLRGVGIRRRLLFMRGHPRSTLGFGTACTALFWVPCCNVLALPVAVAAATHLLWAVARSDPGLKLPELEASSSSRAHRSGSAAS